MSEAPKKRSPLHLQEGREQRVAVVFSCPGRHEEAAGHPAAGSTGRNLEILLTLLGQALNRSDLARVNVTITNAWPLVEYRGKTGRTEATVKEITAEGNTARLQQELAGITDFVIFCGARARSASGYLRLEHHPRFVFVKHLGLRGLSLIRRDVGGEPIVAAARRDLQGKNNLKRLEVVAHSIVSQLRSP